MKPVAERIDVSVDSYVKVGQIGRAIGLNPTQRTARNWHKDALRTMRDSANEAEKNERDQTVEAS